GHDAHRNAPFAVCLIAHDEGADMVLAHELRRLGHGGIARGGHHLCRAYVPYLRHDHLRFWPSRSRVPMIEARARHPLTWIKPAVGRYFTIALMSGATSSSMPFPLDSLELVQQV